MPPHRRLSPDDPVTRRQFLKWAGSTGLALFLAGCSPEQPARCPAANQPANRHLNPGPFANGEPNAGPFAHPHPDPDARSSFGGLDRPGSCL